MDTHERTRIRCGAVSAAAASVWPCAHVVSRKLYTNVRASTAHLLTPVRARVCRSARSLRSLSVSALPPAIAAPLYQRLICMRNWSHHLLHIASHRSCLHKHASNALLPGLPGCDGGGSGGQFGPGLGRDRVCADFGMAWTTHADIYVTQYLTRCVRTINAWSVA